MRLKAFCAAAAAAAMSTFVPAVGHAAVNYVKICDNFGAGYSYIPGTDTCVKVATGETAQDTENGPVYGKTPLAEGVDAANASAAAANASAAALQDQVTELGNSNAASTAGLQDQVTALGNSNAASNAALQQQVTALGNSTAATTANLQQQINAANAANQALNNRIDQVFDAIDKANEGSAVMGALPMPYIEAGHNFAIAGNFAQFESSGAFGLGGAVRLSSNLTFNGSVAVGAQQSTVGGRVGFNLSW
jgi:hypothetical protein